VKDYFESDYFRWTKLDSELFEYLYKTLPCMEDTVNSDGWVKYYDYPDKRLFYKKEDGKALGTVITDSVTESTLP